jgi:hypothetical protein
MKLQGLKSQRHLVIEGGECLPLHLLPKGILAIREAQTVWRVSSVCVNRIGPPSVMR